MYSENGKNCNAQMGFSLLRKGALRDEWVRCVHCESWRTQRPFLRFGLFSSDLVRSRRLPSTSRERWLLSISISILLSTQLNSIRFAFNSVQVRSGQCNRTNGGSGPQVERQKTGNPSSVRSIQPNWAPQFLPWPTHFNTASRNTSPRCW